jgi:chaperone required for assembly of F1-ATPase
LKRFWKEAAAVPRDDGWGIELDGKPVRTPARNRLVVPTEDLAEAVVAEWKDAPDMIGPRSMPLTGLANAAIDRVDPDKQAFADGLARYGESDLLCYRAEGPRELQARQKAAWDELLAWGQRRFDVDFETTCGIVHVTQPDATVARLAHAVSSLDAFHLAALSPLVTMGGSLLVALAVLEGHLSAERAWEAVTIDEQWQREQWGADSEAEAALEAKRSDFFAAGQFLKLLKT